LDWSLPSGTERRGIVYVPRENTATLRIIPSAVPSAIKVGECLSYGALCPPLLILDVLEPGFLSLSPQTLLRDGREMALDGLFPEHGAPSFNSQL
jgi:hypothetical protein